MVLSKIKTVERLFFIHHLSLILRSGIPLPKALLILADQSKNRRFKKIIRNVETMIQRGNSFEQSLSRYKHVFSNSLVSMVRIGELKGDLATVLDGYYQLLLKQNKIRSKVTSALIYPSVVVAAMILVSIFAVVFIFPQLVELVAEFEGELPLITRMAIAISSFITDYGLLLLLGFIALIVFGLIFARLPMGKWLFHGFYLRVPIFGQIVTNYNIAVFARNFGTLLKASISMTESLHTTASTMQNVYYKRALMQAQQVVRRGDAMNEALKHHPTIFPEIVRQIIVVGEQSGTVDTMTIEIADFYEDLLLRTLDGLASIIEPVIILLLGAGVTFLALSILLPLYSLTSLV